MPTYQEIQQLVLQVQGVAEVERLNQVLAAENKTLEQLVAAKKAGLITDAAYEAQLKRTGSSILTNNDALKKTQNSVRDYRQNVTALGYAFNDFFSVSGNLTQRLNSIANNMPGILAGWGAWGLVLSGLLPIIGMLIPVIEKLAKSLGFGESEKLFNSVIDNLKLKIKELEDNPAKIGADTTELDAAKLKLEGLSRALAAFEAAKRTAVEEDLAAQAGKAVKETMGSEGFEKAVFESTKASGDVSMVPQEIVDTISGAPGRIAGHKAAAAAADSPELAQFHEAQIPLIKKELEDAKKAFDKKLHEHAKAVVGSFLTGDVGAISQIYNLTQASPGAFDKTTREAVGQMPRTGEQVAEVRQANRDADKESKEIDRGREVEKKAKEVEDARVDRIDADRAQRMETQKAALAANEAKIREEQEAKLTAMAEKGKADREPAATTRDRMQARALQTANLDPKAAEDAAFVVVRDIMKAVEKKFAAALPEPGEAKGPMLRDTSKLKGLELRKARRQNAQTVETRRKPKGAIPAPKGLALRAQKTRQRKQAAAAKKSKMAFARMSPEEQREEMEAQRAQADLIRKQKAAEAQRAGDAKVIGEAGGWQGGNGQRAQPGADLNPMRPMAPIPRRPDPGANGFPSVPATDPDAGRGGQGQGQGGDGQGLEQAAGALHQVGQQQGQTGARSLKNQGMLISVAQMMLQQQQQEAAALAQQGQAIQSLYQMTANGLSARTAAPRGRG